MSLYNTIRVRPIAGSGVVLISPAGGDERTGDLMVATLPSAELFFRRTRKGRFGFEIAVQGDVPAARGLGYSATVRVGVLAALNELTGARLERRELLELATELEGYPNKASPAIFGGLTVSGRVGSEVRCLRFPVDQKVRFVTLIPQLTASTGEGREFIPKFYSRSDTTHALNRSALITAAFASGDYAGLRGLFDDRVHQPYRESLVPKLNNVIQAGERAGAVGGFLSGSGGSIVCVTLRKASMVAKAMLAKFRGSEVRVLAADNAGFEFCTQNGAS